MRWGVGIKIETAGPSKSGKGNPGLLCKMYGSASGVRDRDQHGNAGHGTTARHEHIGPILAQQEPRLESLLVMDDFEILDLREIAYDALGQSKAMRKIRQVSRGRHPY